MGHPSHQRMLIMKQCYSYLSSDSTFICNTCHLAKQRKLSFSLSHSHASKPFELLHMDIWGLCSATSMNGHKYFLTIIDDNMRYTWVFLMVYKAKTRSHITNFIAEIENQFSTSVKTI